MKKGLFVSILFLILILSGCSFGLKKNNTQEIKQNNEPGFAVYENNRDKVRFKYDKSLSYKIDHSLRYDGFERYVGFAPGNEVERGDDGYPVEFVIIPEQKESEYTSGNRYVSGFKKDGKYYYFSTNEMNKYGELVDEMASTLEFVN